MAILLVLIETCLISSPLSKLSDNLFCTSYLISGHFLIPNSDLCDTAVNRLDCWLHVQQITQQIWKEWSVDFLNTLQQCQKWTMTEANLKVGDVVIIKEDNLPPLHWKIATVDQIHSVADNLVHVVTLCNEQGMFKRPVVKLCELTDSNKHDK